MRFAACLKKDIRLLTGGGIRSLAFLILPVLLIFIMIFGMSGVASADINVKSFRIAIRDNDNTVMSRMLITQLEKVELFDSIVRAGDKTDEELAGEGCAAVVTIPQWFFYMLYDMQDTDVVIALNGDMPEEAAMVKSAFSSLVGILEENQRVYYAEARARYGDLDEDKWNEVYHNYSSASLEDALGRLDFFELAGVYSKGFDAKKLFFGSSLISMLIMFIPLSLLRSVSEEMEAGLSERFALSGGSLAEALLSKLVIAFVMTFIPVVFIIMILKLGELKVLVPVLLICFDFSFAFFLFIGVIAKKASTAQLAGNLIMLLMLTVGGALYPYTLLPAGIKRVSEFMLPRIILSSMQYASMGRGFGEIFIRLLPVIGLAILFFLLSLPFFKVRRRV